MTRTIVNIDPDDKLWLDREAKRRHVPMTELVRQALREYRVRSTSLTQPDLQATLVRTAGIWRGGDALAYQKRLRKEWDRSI
jgi:hypothetical protein